MLPTVQAQFNRQWYKHHNATCTDRTIAGAIATGLTVAMFSPVLHVRLLLKRRGAQFFKSIASDVAWVTLVAGAFRLSYCEIGTRTHVPLPYAAATAGCITGSLVAVARAVQPRYFPVYCVLGSIGGFLLNGLVP